MFGDLLKGLQNTLGGLLGGGDKGIDTTLILEKIKSGATTAGRETTKMGLELWYVMKAKDTKTMDKVIIGSALAYQFLPNDMISTKDFGVLGTLDNAIALGVAYKRMKKYVTPELEAQAEAQLNKWFSGEKNQNPVAEPAAIPAPETDI